MNWSLYLVTDPGPNPDRVPEIVAEAIAGGVTVVQYRDKKADDATFLERARAVKEVCDRAGIPFFVNDRLHIAQELHCHLHIGQGDIPFPKARATLDEELMIGLSISRPEEIAALTKPYPDVLGLGPVFPTPTKPDHDSPIGLDGLLKLQQLAPPECATISIGGMTPDFPQVCDGKGVVSAIMTAPNPRAAARAFSHRIPRVLSIAGTDPTGGAGIQADLKSISAAGGFAMSAVTALVAQNTHGVRSIHTPDPSFLREQLDAVSDDAPIDAIKIGMLGTTEIIHTVRDWLKEHNYHPVVLDPVMVATSGDRLLDASAEAALRELCTLADVITPNLPELAVLAEDTPATSMDAAIEQAKKLGTTVIVKGGHLNQADNAVVHPDGRVHHIYSTHIDTPHTHGTGCSLSSAIATRLCLEDIDAATEWSTRWLNESIRHAAELEVASPGGHGPVHHFHRALRLSRAASSRPRSLPRPKTIPAHIAPAGIHTSRLWHLGGGYAEEIYNLDFIKDLRSGDLDRQDFEFYLAQDAEYLNRYARALALVSAKAPNPADQATWAEGARMCIEAESELHRGELDFQASCSPITQAYTDFLIARASVDPYVVGVAAVLPCYWLYAEVGLVLAGDNLSEDHPYYPWLGMYSGQEFIDGARWAVATAEAAFAAATEEERAAATQAYLDACVHEREFFDQASRRF